MKISCRQQRIAEEAQKDWENLSKWLDGYGPLAKQAIQTFRESSNQLKAQERDLYWWIKNKQPEDFIFAMRDIRNSKEEKRLKDKLVGQTKKLVAENDTWKVYKIESHEAARLMGKGTKWCITMEDSRYWNYYTEDGDQFYYLIRKKPEGDDYDKIAIEYSTDDQEVTAFWDAGDNKHLYLASGLDIPKKIDGIPMWKYLTNFAKLRNYILTENNFEDELGDEEAAYVETLVINSRVPYLRPFYFEKYKNLKKVIIQDGKLDRLPGSCFKGCENLQMIRISGSITKIDANCFQDCEKLEEVQMPYISKLETLGYCSFYRCGSLENISLPSTLEIVGQACFKGCEKLSVLLDMSREEFEGKVSVLEGNDDFYRKLYFDDGSMYK